MSTSTSPLDIMQHNRNKKPDYPQTPPLSPPKSKGWRLSRTNSASSTSTEDLQRPYIHLLMPEPSPDHALSPERRKEEVALWNKVLFRHKINKDWKSYAVFDDHDDFDYSLSPLCAASSQ